MRNIKDGNVDAYKVGQFLRYLIKKNNLNEYWSRWHSDIERLCSLNFGQGQALVTMAAVEQIHNNGGMGAYMLARVNGQFHEKAIENFKR